MPSAIETAFDTYVRAFTEPDPAARAQMIEACWAVDGRLVSKSREIRGREALAEFMAQFAPRVARIRRISALDCGKTIFRIRGIADLRDGTSAESFDAGEIDADGRIKLILTFAGPLVDA
ncbi:MAG: hypothetical protein HOV81_11525 [Kofleriaceae bacterium]|nr:hypothetical protein [Kofleriaceae bacterium]